MATYTGLQFIRGHGVECWSHQVKWRKNFDDRLSRYDTVLYRDRQTDRHLSTTNSALVCG